jgi:hypothetical protein
VGHDAFVLQDEGMLTKQNNKEKYLVTYKKLVHFEKVGQADERCESAQGKQKTVEVLNKSEV